MKQSIIALLAAFVLLATTGAAGADSTQQTMQVEDATTVIGQFVDIPENAIPPTLLRKAYGIAVIPGVLKVGFILGGRRGTGVLSVRTAHGRWSDPVFITLTGGSIGWQAGLSSTDIILVFKNRGSIDRIANGQISLGGDLAVAAGPVGRSVSASTNLDFNAEVYSYSRARGLFAGASVAGARIGIDEHANGLFYDTAGIEADKILHSSDNPKMPKAGRQFVSTLDHFMPALTGDGDNGGRGNSAASGGASGGGPGNGQTQPYDNDRGVTVQRRGQGGSGQGGSEQGGSDNKGRAGNYGAGSFGGQQHDRGGGNAGAKPGAGQAPAAGADRGYGSGNGGGRDSGDGDD